MTTPSPVLAPATAAEWSWLGAAVGMARLYWPGSSPVSGPAGNVTASGDPRSAQPAVTSTVAPAACSLRPARALVVRTMRDWGEAGRAGDVAAVASELLANAVRHALPAASAAGDLPPSPIRLGLQHAGSCVVCAVADPSSDAPVLRRPDWQDESGRGLVVVASLSDCWGHCLAPGAAGKVVWAAFAAAPGRGQEPCQG